MPLSGPLADGITRIDLRFRGRSGLIAAYLLHDGDETALVETGPAITVDRLLEGVEAAGVDPGGITRIFLTHIHLDHAGGAGLVAERCPRARFHVHPRGAPHLIDPSRLLRSAARIYGEELETLWGEIRPVPAGRIVQATDGEIVRMGERILLAVETPGHAGHHHAYHEPETGTVFTGDVAGIRLPGSGYVRAPTPPPEIDLAAWCWSVSRLRALDPRRLCLTHFGAYEDVADHLDRLIASLHRWAGRVEAWAEAGATRAWMTERLKRMGDAEVRSETEAEGMAELYEASIGYGMSVDGLLRAVGMVAADSEASLLASTP